MGCQHPLVRILTCHNYARLEQNEMKIAVIGTGYVGLVTGVCFSEMGNDVSCVDIDRGKIDLLNSGKSPIYEPGIEELIERNIEHERLTFTTDVGKALEGASCVFIAVGTPQDKDGSADLKYVLSVAKEIATHMSEPLVVIVKSTVPVGTCDKVEELIRSTLNEQGKKIDFSVASNPEFLKEGAAIDDFMHPDRVVCGIESGAAEEIFKELYLPFLTNDPGRLLFMDRKSSELTKYASNAMLAVRISFMNELSQLIDKTGGNIDQIRRGMGMDPRIGKKFLYAGPGYGGSCFPKDVAALQNTAKESGMELGLIAAAEKANEAQKNYGAKLTTDILGEDLSGQKIALWGLAFKPKTDDVRDTPALNIARRLLGAGATLHLHDPQAIETFKELIGPDERIKYFPKSYYEASEDCSALILVTEWLEYRRPNWDKLSGLLRNKVVIDLRNQYRRMELERRGYRYACIGRPGVF